MDDDFGRNVEIITQTGIVWLWGNAGQPPDYELTNWTGSLEEYVGRYAEAKINGVEPCSTFQPGPALRAFDDFLDEVTKTPYTWPRGRAE